MRRLKTTKAPPGRNSMQDWYKKVHPFKVGYQFIIIIICRYMPSLRLKNFLYRRMLGMKIGKNVSFGLMAMVDIFFPGYISIEDNSIIGYNTTILTHEFLVEEFRLGRVQIGDNVMIGANVTVLPGVSIGSGARVGAGSVVTRDIPDGCFACGIPAREINNSS